MTRLPVPARGSLFRKYILALFAAVVVPLLAAGASEAWFGYRDQRAHLNDLLGAEARAREAWLSGMLQQLTAEERAVLREAAVIIDKLASG